MVVGAACLDETDLVLLVYGVVATAGPSSGPLFLLLGPFVLVIVGLLGVCCEGAKVGASTSYPSVVIVAMMSRKCFAPVGVRVTLFAAAANSASIGSASSSEA